MTKNNLGMEIDKAAWDAVKKELKEIPLHIAKNALRAAIKNSAERTRSKSAALLAMGGAVDTGRLREAIKAKVKSNRYGNNFFKATVGVAKGKKRDDKGGAYYAGFVEFGHAIVGKDFSVHGSIPAIPFLRNGLQETSADNVKEFASKVKAEIDKRMKRLPKARKK